MTLHSEVRDGVNGLREAINSGVLNDALRKRAQEILNLVERPVRLTTFGLPNSGKSQIINLLAGANVLPEGLCLPTFQLTYGEEAVANCTLPDGSIQSMSLQDMRAISEIKPVFVDAKMPLPALTKLSMLEVVAGASPQEQQRAMMWAAKRTDIALWCTREDFGDKEQALWTQMPEALQDHAFLMMTRADDPALMSTLQDRVQRTTQAGREYFQKVLPIGTKSALAARQSDGSVDKDALRQSGGMALISAILRAVEAGRQGARDQADVFLRQIDFTAQPNVPTPSPAPKAEPREPIEAIAARAETSTATLGDASRVACEQAVAQLAAEGAMMADARAKGGLDDAGVIEICVDTVVWLADFLADSGEDNDPIMSQARATAVDAADLVQLIQMETGDTVASDSVSIMVQVKQEMQAALAA